MADRDTLREADALRVAEVFETHRQFVEAVALTQFNGDRAEAAEVVQDVAVRLCRHLNGFRGDSALRSWIYRLTISAVHDRRRAAHGAHSRTREARETAFRHMAETPADTVDPDAHVLDRERRDVVARAIRSLPPTERTVVRRLFGIGKTAAEGEKALGEVAEEMGLSRAGVYYARERAFERLRQTLGNRRRRLL